MYEAIQGILKEKEPSRTVVETGGIFYRLLTPLSTFTRLPALETPILLYLSHVVREDSQSLYGFLIKEERDLFETLIHLSGIGPKTAAGIIGHMELGAFQKAISNSDIRILSKIPGIGKKTAERLVIELRDKLIGKSKELPVHLRISDQGLASDAVSALLNLGYGPLDAQKAVRTAIEKNSDENDLGRLISNALRNL